MKDQRIETHRRTVVAAIVICALWFSGMWFSGTWFGAGRALAAGSPEVAQADAMRLLREELDKAAGGFELGGDRALETRYFYMETRLTHYEPDGARSEGVTFRLWLELEPEDPAGGAGGMNVVCRKFTITRPGRREVELPTLRDWSYQFSLETAGADEQGQIFGIPHKKFALLVDARGDMLDSNSGYMVYNAFIDFHGFNDVLAIDTGDGGGIQDLRRIGDVVVHAAAESEPPVGLGEAVKKGSVFRNGRITLGLKGVSLVDGRPCALLGYDSGESSYFMVLEPMKGMDLEAKGASHYFGDLHVDLATGWLRKATLFELVVSEMQTGKAEPNHSIVERAILLETLSRADMDRL